MSRKKQEYHSLLGGEVFNELKFIRYVGSKRGSVIGEFSCSCGAVCEKRIMRVVRGDTMSCGHLHVNGRVEEMKMVDKIGEGFFDYDAFIRSDFIFQG